MVTNVLPLLVQLHVMAMRKKMINDNQVMVVGQPYWSFKAPLPQPRLAPAMVVLGGKPLLTGGSYEVKYLLSHRNSGVRVDLRMIRGAFKTNFR